MNNISRFHYITQDVPGSSHAQLAEFACRGGADWVQLRMKNRDLAEWKKEAEETKKICSKYGAKLIINDNVEIAAAIEADGVHLGKNDMTPKEARMILGSKAIIGASTNSISDVKKMMDQPVDYIGLGPYRFTTTKTDLNPVLGLEGIRSILHLYASADSSRPLFPVIAIGGIRVEDADNLFDAGVYGIAVSSAVNLASDKIKSVSRFIASLNISYPNNKIPKRTWNH